jgi:hypothetical protein
MHPGGDLPSQEGINPLLSAGRAEGGAAAEGVTGAKDTRLCADVDAGRDDGELVP